MAAKTANVLARVEPEVKEQAEAIMAQLGIPTSVVINMLYRQIILTRGIPFPLSVLPTPIARDEMNEQEFDAMMQRGLSEATENRSRLVGEVFADLRQDVR